MAKAPKPCLHREADGTGCIEYAFDGARCPEHAKAHNRQTRPGTSGAWRKARWERLVIAHWRCESCGKSQARAKADSSDGKGLHVHHVGIDAEGIHAAEHDIAGLRALCQSCHAVASKDQRQQRKARTSKDLEGRHRGSWPDDRVGARTLVTEVRWRTCACTCPAAAQQPRLRALR